MTSHVLNGLFKLLILERQSLLTSNTYSFPMVISIVSGFVGLLSYGLLGSAALTGSSTTGFNFGLEAYLVSGVSFASILVGSPNMLTRAANQSFIEQLLLTPTNFQFYLVSVSMSSLLSSSLVSILSLAVTSIILGVQFVYVLPLFLITMLIGYVIAYGFALIGLSIQIGWKRGSIFSFVVNIAGTLFSNMFVPIQTLPSTIRWVSLFVPQFYFFTMLRDAFGLGSIEIGTLAGFVISGVVLIAIAEITYRRALRRSKLTGGLSMT